MTHIPNTRNDPYKKRLFLPNLEWFLNLGGGALQILAGGVLSLHNPKAPTQISNST